MQLELDNIQDSVIPYGMYQNRKIKDIPVRYFQEMKDKAPNKRFFVEKLILKFINEENDKYNLINKLSGATISLKVDGVEIPLTCEKVKQMQLNKLLSTHKA